MIHTCPHCGGSLSQSKTKGSRLTPDWWPSEDEWNYAEGLGIPEATVKLEAEKFVDYWTAKPGKDGVKLNWTATWRNWCRSAKERMGYGVPKKR